MNFSINISMFYHPSETVEYIAWASGFLSDSCLIETIINDRSYQTVINSSDIPAGKVLTNLEIKVPLQETEWKTWSSLRRDSVLQKVVLRQRPIESSTTLIYSAEYRKL